MKNTTYIGITAFKAPPTRSHVPAIWENMLGTVYARNSLGETRYFDYDWDGAKSFAGIEEPGVDLRVSPFEAKHAGIPFGGSSHERPRRRQVVLWIRRPVQTTST